MHRTFFSLSFFLASTLLHGCADDDDPVDEVDGEDADRYAEILSQVEFGAQMTVIERDGSTWSGAGGNAASGTAMTTDHVLLIGSATKMLTGAVVLQLVEEGKLGLDDVAVTWVPQLRDDITIRMLLQHTSGMGEYFDHEAMNEDDRAARGDAWTPEQLVALGMEVRNVGPTAQVEYANTNYIALGLVVQAITGRPFDEVLDDRIFAPLDMASAGLRMADEPSPTNFALGAGGSLGVVSRYHPSVGWAAGSAYMTSADLARFLAAAAAGELYSRTMLAEQLRPGDWTGDDMPGIDVSYGLAIQIYDIADARLDGHLGHADGFASAALLDEESGTTTVVLTNQDDNATPALVVLEALGIELGM